MERKLVKIAGRKPVVGRPFLYATTREFLMRFGLNDLSDLPKVEDMADVLGFEIPGLTETGRASSCSRWAWRRTWERGLPRTRPRDGARMPPGGRTMATARRSDRPMRVAAAMAEHP